MKYDKSEIFMALFGAACLTAVIVYSIFMSGGSVGKLNATGSGVTQGEPPSQSPCPVITIEDQMEWVKVFCATNPDVCANNSHLDETVRWLAEHPEVYDKAVEYLHASPTPSAWIGIGARRVEGGLEIRP